MSQLLVARAVSFAYSHQPVLREVSLSLDAGQVVALLGPNGSGKTTLIRSLLGHLHAEGSIQWDGRDLRAWKGKELARRVAYLPQSPSSDPEHRVGDVLRLGRAPYWQAFGLESAHDLEVVARAGSTLELTSLMDRPMRSLSGGQRQRVFVGRCLVQEPAAMLLDEPSTFLDLKHQIELGALLKKLATEQNIAVLMASHDLNLAASMADQIVLLKNGLVRAQGTPQEVITPEILTETYGVEMEQFNRPGRTPLIFPRI